jgi:hypothetical protein
MSQWEQCQKKRMIGKFLSMKGRKGYVYVCRTYHLCDIEEKERKKEISNINSYCFCSFFPEIIEKPRNKYFSAV